MDVPLPHSSTPNKITLYFLLGITRCGLDSFVGLDDSGISLPGVGIGNVTVFSDTGAEH